MTGIQLIFMQIYYKIAPGHLHHLLTWKQQFYIWFVKLKNDLNLCLKFPVYFSKYISLICNLISIFFTLKNFTYWHFIYNRIVPSLKKTFGGQKAFHERFVLGRSRAFVQNKNEDLELATFEFCYIGNFTCWISGKNEYIEPIKERIERKLNHLDQSFDVIDGDYYDKFSYLTFMSGVIDQLQENINAAMIKFEKVIEM